MAGPAVRRRRRAGFVGIGDGGLDDRVEPAGADTLFDLALPTARIRPYRRPGGTDIGGQERGVVAVRGFVEVAADPYGAAPAVEHRLDEVRDPGLPGAGLATDDHHDRPVLCRGLARGRRKDQPVQHVPALPLGQDHVRLSHPRVLPDSHSHAWPSPGRPLTADRQTVVNIHSCLITA